MKSIRPFPSSPSLTQQVSFGEFLRPGGSDFQPVTWALFDVDFSELGVRPRWQVSFVWITVLGIMSHQTTTGLLGYIKLPDVTLSAEDTAVIAESGAPKCPAHHSLPFCREIFEKGREGERVG